VEQRSKKSLWVNLSAKAGEFGDSGIGEEKNVTCRRKPVGPVYKKGGIKRNRAVIGNKQVGGAEGLGKNVEKGGFRT